MNDTKNLLEIVKKYLKHFPKDASHLGLLLDQLQSGEKLDDRRNFRGHIAGDAIVLSPDKKKTLVIYHKRSKRWQQPGGHWDDGEEGPWVTAPREAYEETGVKLGKAIGPDSDDRVPLHIITGEVFPSKAKKEPHHWHHDFRYGYIANSEKLGEIQDDGIGGAKWVPVKGFSVQDVHNPEISLQRLLSIINTHP